MRGLTLRLVLLYLAFSWLPSSFSHAQDRRLIVVKPDDAELRKEARRLRMCPGTLKNVREALGEAIKLAPEVAVLRPVGLGAHISRFERKAAEELLVSLLQQLDDKARRAATRQEYTALTQSSQELLTTLERIDSQAASKFEDQWPPDPFGPDLREAQGTDPIVAQKMFRQIARDPSRAASELDTLEKGTTNYQLRSLLLYNLMEHGDESAARQLALDTLEGAAAHASQEQQPYAFSNFVRSMMGMFPEMSEQALGALSSWYQAASQAGGGGQAEVPLPNGERVKMTRADQELMSLLQMTGRMNPELAQKIADLSPSLKEQIGAAGGVNALFNPFARRQMSSRRSLLRASPSEMEANLNEAKDIGEISMLVSGLCFEAPEKAEQAFAAILKRLQSETDVQKSVNDFMGIGRQCASCLGELPDSWLQFGRVLLTKTEDLAAQQQQQMQMQPQTAAPSRGVSAGMIGPRGRSGFGLKSFLVGQKAVVDFQGAMAEVCAVEDASERMEVLVAVVESLGNY